MSRKGAGKKISRVSVHKDSVWSLMSASFRVRSWAKRGDVGSLG